MMFDSHFHLTDPRLITELDMDNLPNGVEIGADFESLPAVFAFASEHDGIYCTAGVHPAYADSYSANDMENFVVKNLRNPKFVAIGECGLDYHRSDLPARERQIEVFMDQIRLANLYQKPLVVHSRDAWNDTASILIANKNLLKNGVLIHCMSYTADNALSLINNLADVPVYFAFGGHITHQSKAYLLDTMKVIPHNRILIETDAPYLAPVPKRNDINRPEYILYTAEKMANVFNMTVPEIEQLTRKNAYQFFKIKTASK